ncbi:hypothetical protein [Nocardia cyriacigeorgica]|uniref:hypothetical protein n=1 Tax=Nocardia cyriacigeorgica TaxID=135487 RepID=UPI0024564F85|nr:hypothetical protein [Nocardia cyriacigeorgica]
MTNYERPARQLTAAQEAELMEVFHAWYELFTAGDRELSDQAAWLFQQQVNRGGAWRAAWIRVQDTLSAWWDLPEGMREFLRTAPMHDGFDRRALATVVALADDDDED